MAFWVLIFLMGFVGLWAHWGAMSMLKAKWPKEDLKKKYNLLNNF